MLSIESSVLFRSPVYSSVHDIIRIATKSILDFLKTGGDLHQFDGLFFPPVFRKFHGNMRQIDVSLGTGAGSPGSDYLAFALLMSLMIF